MLFINAFCETQHTMKHPSQGKQKTYYYNIIIIITIIKLYYSTLHYCQTVFIKNYSSFKENRSDTTFSNNIFH